MVVTGGGSNDMGSDGGSPKFQFEGTEVLPSFSWVRRTFAQLLVRSVGRSPNLLQNLPFILASVLIAGECTFAGARILFCSASQYSA
jgi:hypothetical protein